jgi:hypothetical protein
MTEVAALFKQFLYRDSAFIFGGLIVLLSFTYVFRGCIGPDWQKFVWEKFPPASIIVLIVVAAYVIGYAVQDAGGVLRLTPTGRFKPGIFLRLLYRCFSGLWWQVPNYPNDKEFEFEIRLGRREIPEHVIQALERIRSLKVIGMCVGGCLALSALIFLDHLVHSSSVNALAWFPSIAVPLAWFQSIAVPCLAPSVPRDCVIFFVSAVLAACLICLGRIKGMQEMQFYQSIHEAGFPEKKQTGTP